MDQFEFDALYWAHQPPEIAELSSISVLNDRIARAAELATKGFLIDVPIQAWGLDAYYTMLFRQQLGMTWAPSALMQPVTVAPMPGTPSYDPDHAPVGSIKVTLDPADYAPYNPPQPKPTIPPTASPVGALNFANIYFPQAWDASPDGTVITEARGTFRKHRVATIIGFNSYWEKIA